MRGRLRVEAGRALRPRLLLVLALARAGGAVRRVLVARAGGARAGRARLPRRQRRRRHGAHGHRTGGRRGDAFARRRAHVPASSSGAGGPASSRSASARSASSSTSATRRTAISSTAVACSDDGRRAARTGGRCGGERVRAVLEVLGRRGGPRPRRPRLRGGERRERGVSPRRSVPSGRRSRRRRARGCGRATSRRSRSRRRRAAAAASGSTNGASSVSTSAGPTGRSRRTPPTSCCRRHGTCRRDEKRFRGGRGPAERRQVDARQRALRRQGRDRLRQAADDPAAHLRDRERRRLPARPRRPARLPAAARRAHRAHAEDRRCGVRGGRSGPLRALGAGADRRRRPLHRLARLRARSPRRDRAQQGRPAEGRATSRRR